MLTKCPLFQGMDKSSIEELLAQVDHFTKNYVAMELICTPLSFNSHLGIVIEGTVLVYKNTAAGTQLILNQIPSGGFVGLSCLCGNTDQFPGFVQAQSNCEILFLPKDSLLKLFTLHPPILEQWMQTMCGRIHYLTNKIEMLAMPNAKDRLLWFMDHQAPCQSSLKLSKTHLMQHLSVSHASLYRAINKLEEEGHIKRNIDGSISLVVS